MGAVNVFGRSLAAIAFLLLSFAATPSFAAAKASEFMLDNGMKIVVVPDHRAPVVTHMVWYYVGGSDDPPGLSGIAHFFEHLMFKGTMKVPPGEISKIVARNGGQDNAFTSADYTAYYQRIAKDRLQLVMELEADRIVNLNLSEENVRTEREVVREERRTRVESDPNSIANEQMMAALYLSHPYGRPVIGWDEEIQNIGRPEALDFYSHHYAPNNAILVVVGDVEPQEVLRLAQMTYGQLARKDVQPRAKSAIAPREAETRIDFHLANVQLPNMIRSYRVPSYGNSKDGIPESLDVLSTIMGGGATSRLYRALVVEKRLAVNAGAYYQGGMRSSGEFGVYATPRPGVSFDTIEAAIDDVIDSMIASPPAAEEFERARTRLVAAHTYEQDNQMALAQDYGGSLIIGLTVADVEDWPNRVAKVTAEDVHRSAKEFLLKKEAVTGRVSPIEQ